MRALSFVLAFAFLTAGCSVAGSLDRGLPGVGTFAYSGPPITAAAQQPLVMASRL